VSYIRSPCDFHEDGWLVRRLVVDAPLIIEVIYRRQKSNILCGETGRMRQQAVVAASKNTSPCFLWTDGYLPGESQTSGCTADVA
jgi:hypothetical protein